MTARDRVPICARMSSRDPLGVDPEPVWLAEGASQGTTTEGWAGITDDAEPGPALQRLIDRVAASEIDDVLGVDPARVHRLRRAPADAGVALLTPETFHQAEAGPRGAA